MVNKAAQRKAGLPKQVYVFQMESGGSGDDRTKGLVVETELPTIINGTLVGTYRLESVDEVVVGTTLVPVR